MATKKSSSSICAVTRYLTGRFVAVSLSEAERMAAIERIPFSRVLKTNNVELLHVHRSELWAWWSDGMLTTGLGLTPDLCPNCLSASAEELMHTACLSASSRPACGWRTLAQIERVVSREQLAVGPKTGKHRPETLTELVVEYINGDRGNLYTFFSAEGIEDHFFYEVSSDLPVDCLKTSTIPEFAVFTKKQAQEQFCYPPISRAA